MIERRKECPKCKGTLLARLGNIIYCLNSSCDWAIQSKRKDDKEIIPEIHTLKHLWEQ